MRDEKWLIFKLIDLISFFSNNKIDSDHPDYEWSLQEMAIIFTAQKRFEISHEIYGELIPVVRKLRFWILKDF